MRVFAFILTIWGGVCPAQDFECKDFDAFVSAAGNVTLLPNKITKAADCKRSLNLKGQTSLHCAHRFDFRAPDAKRFFTKLQSQLNVCSALLKFDDQRVNHPDSYDLQQYSFDTGVVSVSLKDKSALSATYVFLRAMPH